MLRSTVKILNKAKYHRLDLFNPLYNPVLMLPFNESLMPSRHVYMQLVAVACYRIVLTCHHQCIPRDFFFDHMYIKWVNFFSAGGECRSI